jgi:pimeloyl-ACP methyl ester carboxylesterase
MAKGFSVLNIDLRGYGKSSGEFSGGSKEVFDLKAAVQYAREKKYSKIGVIGFGFGGSVAVRGTLLIPEIKSIVTLGTPYTARVRSEEKPNWASNGLAKVGEFIMNSFSGSRKMDVSDETLNPYLEKMTQPILVIHGKKDKLTPYKEAEMIYRVATGKKSLFPMEGADHADAFTEAQMAQVLKRTTEWFNGTL